MDESASLHAVVRGRVQGVFFRAYVAEKARELGLKGYVRNLHNGREVEVQAEGKRAKLEKLIVYLKTGPPASRVANVTTEWSNFSGAYPTFSILY
jgi:acylphosphatase